MDFFPGSNNKAQNMSWRWLCPAGIAQKALTKKDFFVRLFTGSLAGKGPRALSKIKVKINLESQAQCPLSLRQFFYTSLIQKGRGLWPDEALATAQKYTHVLAGYGANSIPDLIVRER